MARQPTSEEVERANALYPAADWVSGRVEESGKSNLVLIPADPVPEVVFRMARTREEALAQARRAALADALAPHVPWLVPESRSPIDSAGGIIQRFIPGAAHPLRQGDPAVLGRIIADLQAVPLSAYEGLVGAPWEAEPQWTQARADAAIDALEPDVRASAATVLATLGEMEQATGSAVGQGAALRGSLRPGSVQHDPVQPGSVQHDPVQPGSVQHGLVHGDLAGRNMHWRNGELIGILDWDKASLWDPAINLAHLSLWHGQDVIDPSAPDEFFAARAHVWNGSFALTRVADAALRGGVKTWGRLLRKTQPRIMRAAQAAHVCRELLQ